MSNLHKRWCSQHRPGKAHWANRYKKKYRFWFTAYYFLTYYGIKYRGQKRRTVYACYWTDNFRDGESGPKHYHLGGKHPRKST